ncbi:MAG: NAD(P)/FAD-dependent oxidoreductase [Candidatus Riflemargulisbacteria bacterium]
MSLTYDLIIIGGGPAGMIAGISAKTNCPNAKILILEKNDSCGKKLLITGNGRCNLTTANIDINIFMEQLGKKGKWMRDALNAFPVDATIDFFTNLGIELHTEGENRIFPASENAVFVRDKLIRKLKDLKVEIKYSSSAKQITNDNKEFLIITKDNSKYIANTLLISTGGLSYPTTGSTGDGYILAERLGHSIIKPTAALTSLKANELWIKDLAGISLKDVKVEVFQSNFKQEERFGDILFTHSGLSGPLILNLSKHIHHLMNNNSEPISFQIDTLYKENHQQLDLRLQKICQGKWKKSLKTFMQELMPTRMAEVFIEYHHLDPNKQIASILKEERKLIINSLKQIIVTLGGVDGFEKATITSGGVNLKEVNPKTMESTIIPNLYFSGEILDIDGPTGGYNLQIAWSTGYLAGESLICNS